MVDKKTRYIIRIFTLDRFYNGTCFVSWNYDLSEFLESENKHYGLKIINEANEVLITMEYSNIIWQYQLFFGSYKKRYKPLDTDDERWTYIENGLLADLNIMGLGFLKDEVLFSLKNKKYYEYKDKSEEQFKRYCV